MLTNDTFAPHEDQHQQLEVLKELSVSLGQRLQPASEASPERCLHACIFASEVKYFYKFIPFVDSVDFIVLMSTLMVNLL